MAEIPKNPALALADHGPDAAQWASPREQGRGPPCPVRRLAPGASRARREARPEVREGPNIAAPPGASELFGADSRCMNMRRRVAPRTVLTIGLCLVSVSFVMWAVASTVVDRGPLHDEARTVLSESPAQKAMTTRLSFALATTGGVDPAALEALVERTMQQPEFVEAFAGALDRMQEHVVEGATGAITLNPGLVTEAVRAAAIGNPQVNATVTTQDPVVVQIPDDEIPDLAQWARLWEAVLRGLAFLGLLVVTYGLLVSEHRVWAVGRIGRWAIVVGAGTLALLWLAPHLVVRWLGGWIAVGGAVAGASEQLVPVALALVALGALAVIGAHRWGHSDRKRVLSRIPRAPTRSARSRATTSTPAPTRWESPV
jgi:hypothetical protein